MPTAYRRWLAATALAYALLHHLGLLPSGLGPAPRDTQWVDWLDLLVPWLVLVPAALTLRAGQPPTRTWVVFGAGVVAYASGHGIHLAANSVSNAVGGGTVVMSLVLAAAGTAYGWTRRRELGVVLLVAGLPAVAILVAELAKGTT